MMGGQGGYSAETWAIFIALGALVIGMALAFVINRLKLGDSATFIALLFTPLLLYGVASGKIQEFSAGSSGVSAKFREIAESKVTPVSEQIHPVEPEIVEKASPSVLLTAAQRLPKNKPAALSLQLGRSNYYSVPATIQYIETLIRVDSELTVLIVDGNGKFVAMAEAATVLGYLKDPAQGLQLIDAIGNGSINYLKMLPGLVFESLSEKTTNSDALGEMRKLNTKTMVVVDDTGKPRGIVKRADIVANLLESLATPSKK
jgi:hypothetical protein